MRILKNKIKNFLDIAIFKHGINKKFLYLLLIVFIIGAVIGLILRIM